MNNLALVMFAYGKGYILTWVAEEYIAQYISDCGGSVDGFDLDYVTCTYTDPKCDGLMVANLSLVDDGPGDYSGTRECILQLDNWRPATEKEWTDFREGNWPWEPPPHLTDFTYF